MYSKNKIFYEVIKRSREKKELLHCVSLQIEFLFYLGITTFEVHQRPVYCWN